MRIGLVCDYFPPLVVGGAELSAYHLAEALAEAGHEVTVLTPRYGQKGNGTVTGRFRVCRIPFPQKLCPGKEASLFWLTNPIFQFWFAFRIWSAARKANLEILHAQHMGVLVPTYWAACWKGCHTAATLRDFSLLNGNGFAYFLDAHGKEVSLGLVDAFRRNRLKAFFALCWESCHRRLRSRTLKRYEAILPVSQALSSLYIRKGYDQEADRFHPIPTVPPPFPRPSFLEAKLRKNFRLPESAKIVLYLGKISEGKGCGILFKAMEKVQRQGKDALLVMASRNSEALEQFRISPTLNLKRLPQVSNEDALSLMTLASVVVVPSVRPEPFSRVLLEAMTLGRPVVATRTGGSPELLSDKVGGLLVDPDDPEALADALLSILEDPASAEEMGHRGQERIRRNFSKEKIAGAHEVVYRQMLATKAYPQESLPKRFGKSFFWNMIHRIIGGALTFVTSILVARALGPGDFGLYAVLWSLVYTIVTLTTFGFSDILSVFIPRLHIQDQTRKHASHLFRNLLRVRSVVLILLAFVLFGGAEKIASLLSRSELAPYLRIAAPLLVVIGVKNFFHFLFASLLKLKAVTLWMLGFQGLGLLFLYLAFRMGGGLGSVIGVTTVVSLLMCGLLWMLTQREFPTQVRTFDLKPFYTFGMVAWLGTLTTLILDKQMDLLLLSRFRVPVAEIGFYNLAFNLFNQTSFFTLGIGGLAQAAFSEIWQEGNREKLEESWRLMVKMVSFLAIPFLGFGLIHAEKVIAVLYSPAYAPAAFYLQIFILFQWLFMFLGAGYGIPALLALGKAKLVLALRLLGAVLNLGLNLLWIPRWGALGAVLATGLAVTTMTLAEMVCVKRKLNAFPPFGFILKLTLICLLALIPTLWVGGENLSSLLGMGGLFVVFGAVILFFIRPLSEREKGLMRNILGLSKT